MLIAVLKGDSTFWMSHRNNIFSLEIWWTTEHGKYTAPPRSYDFMSQAPRASEIKAPEVGREGHKFPTNLTKRGLEKLQLNLNKNILVNRGNKRKKTMSEC